MELNEFYNHNKAKQNLAFILQHNNLSPHALMTCNMTSYIPYVSFCLFIDPSTHPISLDFSMYFKFGNPCWAGLVLIQNSEESSLVHNLLMYCSEPAGSLICHDCFHPLVFNSGLASPNYILLILFQSIN